MRVGIYGGTFNPVHLGHLLLAETARDQLRLDRVLFIPTGQPPHKSARGLLPAQERLRLLTLATRSNPVFAVSSIELDRPGPSYTIDTLRTLRERLPEARLFLLMGQDMLTVRWKGWDELKKLCTLAVARRPGGKTPARQRGLVWLTMPLLEISSSDIRARIKAGRSIRYLVPPAVEQALRARPKT